MILDIANPEFDAVTAIHQFRSWLMRYDFQGHEIDFDHRIIRRWLLCKHFNRTCYEHPNSKRCGQKCPIADYLNKNFFFEKETDEITKVWLMADFIHSQFNWGHLTLNRRFMFNEDMLFDV